METMPAFHFLHTVPLVWTVLATIIILMVLGYVAAPFYLWMIVIGLVCWGLGGASPVFWGVFALIFLLFAVPVIRRIIVAGPLLRLLISLNIMPSISDTEKEAIDAGTVWLDAELFSGKPDFNKILKEQYPKLSAEEQAFLDGPVNELCAMVDEWKVYQDRDFDEATWQYMKDNRFFGMIIPKQYGGLEFSAYGHSAVITRIASRSVALAITVMVPNSLGPAELLIHYGTDEQKNYYLPRLARGEEIPCFGLTEPHAGSDAGAIVSTGEVFRDKDNQLYLRLNWEKRWITLASISTVIGLAFKLTDPNNLLGKGTSPGITCALIPSSTPGVVIGRRHDPLGVPFYNCPTSGKDVVIPVDAIIGGKDGVGRGWRMLMESLSAGRGISLPSTCAGGTQLSARVIGAFAKLRRQFGLEIGKFEGVQEPMARIAGFAYIGDALRRFTCGALDSGAKPGVISAIAKYHSTEMFRQSINDAMDITGGWGISMGPKNLLGQAYQSTPIGITVEGANILTRSLMIFGQGAIRCHPYVLKEIEAIEKRDTRLFNQAFFSHIRHVVRNKVRALVLAWTGGILVKAPVSGWTARYYRRLGRVSPAFAFLADMALGTLGGDLKRKERIAARFGDVLSWMYMVTAVLRRYEADGRPAQDRAVVQWSLEYAFYQMQLAFNGLFRNMPLMRLFSFGFRLRTIGKAPSDDLGSEVAKYLMTPGEARDRLTYAVYRPQDDQHRLAVMDKALRKVTETEDILKKVVGAMRTGDIKKTLPHLVIEDALKKGIISKEEAAALKEAEALRDDVIQVSSFTQEEYMTRSA